MDIAFWSNVRHQSGVTSCVALMSVLWVELFVEEIAVTSNHICNYSLVNRLYGGSGYEERTARKAYSYVLGEPEYFRMLYDGTIRTALWLNDSLQFVPMEGDAGELFSTQGLHGVNKRVEDKSYLMIDTACGYSLGSQRILEEAEVTVVLFPDCKECVDTFFQSETTLRDSSFFIFGNHPAEASCSPAYLTRRYHIPEERIGVIPYNLGFEQAMREGSTISYVTRNMKCSKRDSAYPLIYSAIKTVKRLRNYAMSRKEDSCGEYEKV